MAAVAVELACVVPGPPRDNPAAQGPPSRSSAPPRRRNRAGRPDIDAGVLDFVHLGRRPLVLIPATPPPRSVAEHAHEPTGELAPLLLFSLSLFSPLAADPPATTVVPPRQRARPQPRPDRPGGWLARAAARPRPRPGPAQRLAASGNSPAQRQPGLATRLASSGCPPALGPAWPAVRPACLAILVSFLGNKN